MPPKSYARSENAEECCLLHSLTEALVGQRRRKRGLDLHDSGLAIGNDWLCIVAHHLRLAVVGVVEFAETSLLDSTLGQLEKVAGRSWRLD